MKNLSTESTLIPSSRSTSLRRFGAKLVQISKSNTPNPTLQKSPQQNQRIENKNGKQLLNKTNKSTTTYLDTEKNTYHAFVFA